ncbi:unnamed protein product [Cylicocyclus nassatus]|uniref:Transthyretin-like family protein n=1 Tax=Cylicocyclus nassatus TaxID=53992 RepID=A0AA36H0F0_CYLNA|nr:unnamed protein product [Cylicocyclus nassatus]
MQSESAFPIQHFKFIKASNAHVLHDTSTLQQKMQRAPLLLSVLFKLTNCFSMKVGRLQSVAVTGVLECNGAPAENVKIMLYDKGILSNSKLDEGSTESSGRFYLSWSKREVTKIDPEISIYHNCNHNKQCYKRIRIGIPKKFISIGSIPFYTFDIEKLDLAVGTSGETTRC